MNITESKSELLYSAIYKILKDDNFDTGNTVKEIHFYVEDRIVRKFLRHNLSNPKILMDVEEQFSNFNLPTSRYLLSLIIIVDETEQYALTVLDRISSRLEYLLNKKQASINLAMEGKNLRCRMINKSSAITTYDGLQKIHQKTLMFDVILDDEDLECN